MLVMQIRMVPAAWRHLNRISTLKTIPGAGVRALAGRLSNFLGFSVFLLALATGITGFSDQPSRGAGPDSAAAHWSLLPLQRAEPPAVKDKAWAKTPIDRFILAKLEEQGLQPMPAADQRTLLRRVYFDLIGLPPAPQEMDAFLADRTSRAYEDVVERLLASPRYGERWARHWLDAAHYAETHGNDQDRVRTNAWP